MSQFGYVYDPDRIAAATARIESAGFKSSYSADRPSMAGYWKRQLQRGVTKVLAQDDEMKLTGKYRDPNHQARGICVACGSERAIEDAHTSRIVDGAIVGKHTRIAGEIMYGYERKKRWGPTQPYGTRGQCNDGLAGADAAAFYSTIGCIARENYASVGDAGKLAEQREDLAITWNNTGVPEILIAAAAFHKIACHMSQSFEDYADPIAAKNWGWLCVQAVFGLSRVIEDKFGTVLPDQVGPQVGHCTEVCGIVVLPNHENGWIIQQSWGMPGPKYPKTIQTTNGPIDLRPGSYCVRESVLQDIRGGKELISCDIPSGSSFRAL